MDGIATTREDGPRAGAQGRLLRLVVPDDANVAVGLAVRLCAEREAFASIPFGKWSSTIVGQVARRHNLFVLADSGEVVGYVGWARVSREDADAWADRDVPIPAERCGGGPCAVINVWVAASGAANRLLVDGLRRLVGDAETVLSKRRDGEGRARVSRLATTDAVGAHLARTDGRIADTMH